MRSCWIVGVGMLLGCSVSRAEPSAEGDRTVRPEPRAASRGEGKATNDRDRSASCAPGARRWCAGSLHGGYGIARCGADGRWSACGEPPTGASGPSDRPSTACACRYPAFEPLCCEDRQDRDHDGRPDCLVPPDHAPPACSTDGALGAFCDADTECAAGSRDGLCLLADDGTTLYSFCSRACAESDPCPFGWTCASVATAGRPIASQCFPGATHIVGTLTRPRPTQ